MTTARSFSYLKSQLLLVQQASRGNESLRTESWALSASLYSKERDIVLPVSPAFGKVSISYEEEDGHHPYAAVPASQSKTLKINMDLMLWRSRQDRIKAKLTLNKEERKHLLKQSEDALRRCLSLDPSDARSYVVLGKTLLMQRRYEEARRLYQQGTEATGNNSPFIWSAWGWLEFKTGNVSAARKLYDAAVLIDETHACAWHKWGVLERSEGNYLRARDLWMQGISRCRKKPRNQNAYLYNALAVMAAQVGKVEEARAWFEEGTRTLEGAASVALWQAWAVLEAKQGDPTAVRYLFKRALGVNPSSRYVHLAWAMWERRQNNTELCLQLLKRGQSLNPTDAAIYQAWALVEKDRGRYEEATRLFEAGLKADPNHLPLWQAWGCMERQRGNLDRARELFQEGVWADPRSKDTVFIFHAWGILERDLKNIPFARELFKAAIKVDPKNDVVWSTWVTMELELGFAERADELRIRQAEQQWEFEVPANFTTRPADSPLSILVESLTQFFSVRESSKIKKTVAVAPRSVATAAPPFPSTKPSLRQLLPEDFNDSLSAEDILPTLLPTPKDMQPEFLAKKEALEKLLDAQRKQLDREIQTEMQLRLLTAVDEEEEEHESREVAGSSLEVQEEVTLQRRPMR
ncbi:hypothetical protein CEUSTIGMA_g11276.t1 [Chlamydomonas eustigma]|uniref:Uncharacterized protein n=1 Tax=Chlamydomonas eustigma TaxID=1157962 RepID=A0A250XL72_9CHLO|nr:hypothetical protein CEUSTIGMA_g11276.t1 [Chlamydomonas eustigma]|eukprot:GAX83851.1 hypothetical protein CEUSTIGMA_g11276.t1 [Chlamydomonas eustigma]